MAITVTQAPYSFNAIGQKIIVVATSTNVALDGFKYFVTFQLHMTDEYGTTTKDFEFYISPNPAGALVFDIAPVIKEFIKTSETYFGNSVHGFTDDTVLLFRDSEFRRNTDSYIYEAYNVGGVLTVDLASQVNFTPGTVYINARHNIEDGFKPDPIVFFAQTVSDRLLSDRKKDTYKFTLEPLINADANAIIIPVREADYGVITSTNNGAVDVTGPSSFTITLVDETNTEHTFTEYTYGNFATLHVALFPANLNNSAIALIIKPQDFPNWKFIKIIPDKAAHYYLVNIDHYGIHQECKHDNVRIAWVGSRGGWEYFNFNKKNEESVQVERKRYDKVIGTYAEETFGFLPTDAGLKELKPVVQRFITVNSDWIQEGEFEYLKGLIVSDTVHMVLDSGTHIPMLVEQNDYTAARERNGKMKNLTLKLRYANDLNV